MNVRTLRVRVFQLLLKFQVLLAARTVSRQIL